MAEMSTSLRIRTVEEIIDPSDTFVDFTYTGFGTPKFALITWASSRGPAGRTQRWKSHLEYGIGVWCYANGSFATGARCQHNQTTTNTSRAQGATWVVLMANQNATAFDVVYSCAATTDGVRLTKNTNNLGTGEERYVQVTLFGGTDILNADCGDKQINGSTSITGIADGAAFTPNWCLFLSAGYWNGVNFTSNAQSSFGWAMSTHNGDASNILKQGCSAWYDHDNYSTSSHRAMQSDTTCMQAYGSGGMTVTSFGSGTINYTETVSSTTGVGWLAVEFDKTNSSLMLERFASLRIDGDDTLTNSDFSGTLTDTDKHVGAAIAAIQARSAAFDTWDSTSVGTGCLMTYDPTGMHGGMSYASWDGQSTTSCGAYANYSYAWRMSQSGSGYSGNNRTWERVFCAREGGYNLIEDATYPDQTGVVSYGTTLAFGVGMRNIYQGDKNMVGLLKGVSGSTHNTVIRVEKGDGTLLYGCDAI